MSWGKEMIEGYDLWYKTRREPQAIEYWETIVANNRLRLRKAANGEVINDNDTENDIHWLQGIEFALVEYKKIPAEIRADENKLYAALLPLATKYIGIKAKKTAEADYFAAGMKHCLVDWIHALAPFLSTEMKKG